MSQSLSVLSHGGPWWLLCGCQFAFGNAVISWAPHLPFCCIHGTQLLPTGPRADLRWSRLLSRMAQVWSEPGDGLITGVPKRLCLTGVNLLFLGGAGMS